MKKKAILNVIHLMVSKELAQREKWQPLEWNVTNWPEEIKLPSYQPTDQGMGYR